MFLLRAGFGIGQRRIGQERFERAVTRQLGAAEHFHLLGVERKQQDVLQVIIVIRHAHRREGGHRGQAFFQAIGESMDGDEGCIARFHQIVAFVRREIARQRHEAILKERIDRARGIDCELRVKFHRLLQVAFALREHRRHLLQARSRREHTVPRRVVLFFRSEKIPFEHSPT